MDGLLDFDPEKLKAMMAQFGATPQDTADANKQAAFALGFGLLQGRKGNELATIGQAGMGAMGVRQNYLNDVTKQRREMVAPMMALRKLAQNEQFSRELLGGAGPGQSAAPPSVSRSPSMFNATIPPGVSGVLNDPTKTLPDLTTTPAAPRIEAPVQPKMSLYQRLINMGVPEEAIQAAAASDSPRDAIAGLVKHYGDPVFGQGKIPLLRTAGGGFRAAPVAGGNEALAGQTGAEERAKQQAQSEFAIANVPTTDSKGMPGPSIQMTQAQRLAQLTGNRPPPFTNFQNIPPAERAVAEADMRNPRPEVNAPNVGAYGVGVTASPFATKIAEHAATSTIDTREAAQRGGNEDFVKFSYRPALDSMLAAKKANVSLDVLQKLPIAEKTGWGTEAKVQGARILEGLGVAPDAAKMYASDAQIFNRELGANVWSLLGQQKGMQTEGDAARAKKVFANLENTPRANEFMMDIARATNNLSVKQGEFYAKNYNDAIKSGNVTTLETDWAQKAPSLWDDPAMQKWKSGQAGYIPSKEEAAAELARRQQRRR